MATMTFTEAVNMVKQAALTSSPVNEALLEISKSLDSAGQPFVADRVMAAEPALTNVYNKGARQAALQDAAGTLAGFGTGGLTAAATYGLTGLIPRLKQSKLLRLLLAGVGGGLGYTAGKLGTSFLLHPYNPDFNYSVPRVRFR